MYKYIVNGLILFLLSNTANADFRFIHNGHSYDVITTALTNSEALTAAKSYSINGHQGYLVRIDSEVENTAIFNQLIANIPTSDFNKTVSPDGGDGSYIWLGATDAATEGKWIWEDNKAQFWFGNGSGSAVGGLYNNWGNQFPNRHEPDGSEANDQDQDVGAISLSGWPLGKANFGFPDFSLGVAGQWNDIKANQMLYYIVEYNTIGVEPKNIPERNSNHNAYFLLEIGTPLSVEASIDYTTRDIGSAIPASDYIAKTGTATIAAGDTRVLIGVEIIGDILPEGNKEFELVISNPQGANFPAGITEITARRTIVDDDN